jgi:hypothetical protein
MKTCALCGESTGGRSQFALYCGVCMHEKEQPKENAIREVRRAVRSGVVPHIDTQYCVDCGRFAELYDHRDYTQPLVIEPVCRKCNFRRGPVDWSAYREIQKMKAAA